MLNSTMSKMIGSKRFLNRKLRQFQPITLKLEISKNHFLFVDPKDLYGPSFYVMYGKEAAFYHYESHVKAEILQNLPLNGVFFDIGANIGLISLFISKFRNDSTIFAFEPADNTFMAINETIKANNITNIQVIKKGVADKSADQVSFFIDSKSSGGNSLLESAIGHAIESSNKISLVSVDDYVIATGIIPNVVKVDVQDAEEKVIIGALNTIERHSPTFIIEVNNKLLLENPTPFLKAFKGYTVHRVQTLEKVSIESFPALAKKYFESGETVLDYVFTK